MKSLLEILERSFRRVEIPSTTQVGCPTCGTALSGIYLLVSRATIVYIGSSTDVVRRLYSHRHMSRGVIRRFDSALWLSLPAKVLPFYEGTLIRALRPRGNSINHAPRSFGYDAEILFGLGLRHTLTDDDITSDGAAA